MSESEVERFARDLKADAALLVEVTTGGRLQAAVGIATRRGYSFTLAELTTYVQGRARDSGKELSPADLDAIAGAGCRLSAELKRAILGV
jgi:predicted ribosomally synthesized peptide with nif11-like leader